MDKKEELFLLYNELNMVLNKEHDALEKEDIDTVHKLLIQEREIIQKIDDLTSGKIDYIENEEDRDRFIAIISTCIEKRKENEKIMQKIKDTLFGEIVKINNNKRVLNEYFNKKISDSKFIDRIK